MSAQWEIVIGLEVHTQLSTNSKIFSGASTTYGAEPNTQAAAVSIALTGLAAAARIRRAVDIRTGRVHSVRVELPSEVEVHKASALAVAHRDVEIIEICALEHDTAVLVAHDAKVDRLPGV